ncbi:ATP-binding protein [Pseudomonas sp. p1(2021b)]|uniref:AAA family ATPase n=1 Tax=Pseudomonas sp. p1(2021b) TaxID=2874628 RepID=UPI001CC927B9|nr:AAA family ATPase [Pseudomonas sp. p1(2021b)]UBM27378.1 ATP-binding protein [Pseudomonas sp. p1(2021b)]
MYHDDREIAAEKLIEALEQDVKAITDLSQDARLLLMLVAVARTGVSSFDRYQFATWLMDDPLLEQVAIDIHNQLKNNAERLLKSRKDTGFLITHLAARSISQEVGIDYRHPKLVAALVGTLQATLSTSLFEALPNTAELSLGLLGQSPKPSFPMSTNISERHRNLISLRLAANGIDARFTQAVDYRFGQPTFLLDWPLAEHTTLLSTLENVLEIGNARLVLIVNWTRAETSGTWKRLLALTEGRAHIEALINFSSLPTPSDHCTAIIINTQPPQRDTLYIDVSLSNSALPPLDGIERMLLAGCIYNLWQGRAAHSHLDFLSRDVLKFVNSYFHDGFRPIVGLCNAVEKTPKAISRTRLASRPYLKAAPGEPSRPALSDNSRLIAQALERSDSHRCIYVIGNNGEGKSFLLRDIVYQLQAARKRTIGLPMSHADRFPDEGHLFTYKGARKNTIAKEIVAIAQDGTHVWLLSECLELIGFNPKIYLTLKSELSHDQNGDRRPNILDLSDDDDRTYLNHEKGLIKHYTVSFIREGHRTIAFENLSSGEQSILNLLTRIIASATRDATFLIDEPEISLHVSWQQRLPQVLSMLSERLQIAFVVATHSPILIANAAAQDICYVSKVGELEEIPVEERHSVETLLMDGFETYTPHNREVHERCAKLVASLIEAANEQAGVVDQANDAIEKLEAFKATIRKSGQSGSDTRPANDIDLIEKTLGAILMLRAQSEPHHG